MKTTYALVCFTMLAGLLPGHASDQSDPSNTVPPLPAELSIAMGKFKPDWDSLAANYHCPEWFRDAKFGIWAHWSAQCQPEQGDWYARQMYTQGNRVYDYHLKTFGHPSK